MSLVNIVELKEGHTPEYKHSGDACCDCRASLNELVTIAPKCMVTIPLGFAIQIPHGYEGQIRPRSGLARDKGVFTIMGTVDEGYTGEVCAIISVGFRRGGCDLRHQDDLQWLGEWLQRVSLCDADYRERADDHSGTVYRQGAL